MYLHNQLRKSFLIDPLTTNSAIYREPLILNTKKINKSMKVSFLNVMQKERLLKKILVQQWDITKIISAFCITALKKKICWYWSIDRYGLDPSGQATFYGGHKITVLNLACLL